MWNLTVSCAKNIFTKNCQKLIILLQVTIDNVWGVFSGRGALRSKFVEIAQH